MITGFLIAIAILRGTSKFFNPVESCEKGSSFEKINTRKFNNITFVCRFLQFNIFSEANF